MDTHEVDLAGPTWRGHLHSTVQDACVSPQQQPRSEQGTKPQDLAGVAVVCDVGPLQLPAQAALQNLELVHLGPAYITQALGTVHAEFGNDRGLWVEKH